MYKLNCIVLGDDPCHIFSVNVARTQSVYDLKKVIKDKNKPQFDHVDATHIDLWQVDLPVDETIEHNLNNLTLDKEKRLWPLTKLQKVFSEIPEDEHLHIVIRAAPVGQDCTERVCQRPPKGYQRTEKA
ncbi:uncharacterized protein HD556DRAFT_199653 [Suillus plorans]|uniref:Crinkler effector protein N-terminal domain-containing protein n=1 Tax=Suillus plorans TaxID=116603 RepID=A0A9P7AAR1_9AGAM|nr:uncharacterized protein HD556DRAFT_199653 [Suillus plorans]KAG1784737.1 hypothetical protein HD556DRAFT_199653 [Suillus plorans]